MIIAHNLTLSFSDRILFDRISFTIACKQRIGLVGRNGSGKTTLLEAIIDPALLNAGTISRIKDKKIAYMPQHVVLQSDKSIVDEAYSVFSHIIELQEKIGLLEKRLSGKSYGQSDDIMLEEYTTLVAKLRDAQPESLRAQTKKVLSGLGFSQEQLDTPVSQLSVGWKMRIVLAKLLLQQADFYLFDEPTNHLDLVAKEWFLQFLKRASFGFIIVCHERYFLDELCTHTFELEQGKGTMYNGTFSSYQSQKQLARERLQAAYDDQQQDIKRRTETIEKFRAGTRARQAKSMQKAIDKIERITLPPAPKDVSFTFPPVPMAGKEVLKVQQLSHSYGNRTIFHNISFHIERDQKVAVVAPNGMGKSTLFNLIAQKMGVQKGTITYGHHVAVAIFDQDQDQSLDRNKTILENVRERCPRAALKDIRAFLGSFLFSGDDVHKKVQVLSGGEKNRVGMVTTLLNNANLLLLDEPTNHLDIESKDILVKALVEFRATVLFVSHDRDFINQVATHILELTPQGIYTYIGNYDSYIYQKTLVTVQEQKPITQHPGIPHKDERKTAHELQKKGNNLAKIIEKLERQIHDVEQSFLHVTYGTQAFKDAQQQLEVLKKKLYAAEQEWESIIS